MEKQNMAKLIKITEAKDVTSGQAAAFTVEGQARDTRNE